MVSVVIGIGLPRRTIITTRGASISVMVTRPSSVRTVHPGFVLFALFNYLPIYLFNEFAEGDDFENSIKECKFVISRVYI